MNSCAVIPWADKQGIFEDEVYCAHDQTMDRLKGSNIVHLSPVGGIRTHDIQFVPLYESLRSNLLNFHPQRLQVGVIQGT